jgi:hypothetical protein
VQRGDRKTLKNVRITIAIDCWTSKENTIKTRKRVHLGDRIKKLKNWRAVWWTSIKRYTHW